jgi:hypothetical protein
MKAKLIPLPELETLQPRWDNICIVAVTGETLTKSVAAACAGYPVIAVKQAWKRFPNAEVLYSLDEWWWRLPINNQAGPPHTKEAFTGEKWSAHDPRYSPKIEFAKEYKLRLVRGEMANEFSTNPSVIHYGRNTAFQAINLAIHWLRGPRKIIPVVGLDMCGGYFFGQHPRGQHFGHHWNDYIPVFEYAAKHLPPGVEIINCSPISLLKCFPKMELSAALRMAA